jgi:predicted MFS family arabinose efflux permease
VTRAPALRIATAGIGVVGVTFGMARYGYGLLLPDIRRAYGLGPATLGLIGTGSYVGYLFATAATGALAHRAGPRATAVASGLLAAAGMAVAGLAQAPGLFTAGIVLAGASAALSFAPIADAAAPLPERARSRVLAAANCGTGYGVALAAPIAIAFGADWRAAWLAFAAFALLASAWAARALPRRAAATPAPRGRHNIPAQAMPLLAGGVLIGVGSSAYWTFAVAYLDDAGLSPTTTGAFLAVVGIASVLGTVTGELIRKLGAPKAFALLAATEAAGVALLAVAPARPAAAFTSAVLFGAAYTAAVGVQAITATRLFAERPSRGLSAVMGANGLGLLIGPAAAGALAATLGLRAVLILGAAVILVAAAVGRPQAGAARPGRSARCAARANTSVPRPTAIQSGSR